MEEKKEVDNNFLLIDDMMRRFNYFPNTKEFESINKEIPDNHNFSKVFNNFLTKLKDFDKAFTAHTSTKKPVKYYSSYSYEEYYLFKYLKDNDNELNDYIKEWKEQFDTNTKHICFFIIMVDKYSQYNGNISEYDKNILFWTILFHDLGKYKQMNPFIDEKIDFSYYDKTHPFKSIIIFLNNAFDHDLFFYPNDEYKNELINMYKNEFTNAIFNSWNIEIIDNDKIYNICFKYIEEIQKFFMKIKSQEQNEWIYDICVLIIFHQSLPNNKNRMNSPLLEEKYIKIFFTKRLVELMRIIMVYDSSSHSMFSGSDWVAQINLNMDEVIKLYQ